MASDGKGGPPPSNFPHRGVKIFTYPKIIFIWPTLVASIISAIIMAVSGDLPTEPRRADRAVESIADRPVGAEGGAEAAPDEQVVTERPRIRRFTTPQNLAGVIFLTVFLLNLLVMSIDFPRFTIIGLFLGITALVLLFLYLNVYFELIPPVVAVLESLHTVANTAFYATIATIILINFGIIWVTRYLDYWVIMPNELLHNHGPFSDLERFPTFNLKFNKEIPDILEYALLGAGRLTLNVANERTAIVLDNVLWIDSKENELKKLMSRMDVRVTTDQEAADPR